MRVSIITPSHRRSELHPALYQVFSHQTHARIELLVADSGGGESTFFSELEDPRVRYQFFDGDPSIGAKRNWLVQRARGDVIVHFDDDDYYAPNYVAGVVERLRHADLVTARSWLNYDPANGKLYFLDVLQPERFRFVPHRGAVEQRPFSSSGIESGVWGYGFSYAYRRSVAASVHFEDRDHGEDYAFLTQVRRSFRTEAYPDEDGQIVHTIWPRSTSNVFPQYHLPRFYLDKMWPRAAAYYGEFFPRAASTLTLDGAGQAYHRYSKLRLRGPNDFVFIRGFDTQGDDLGCLGRRPTDELVTICSQLEGAVAFNTGGWIKKALRPMEQWIRSREEHSGLWVEASYLEAFEARHRRARGSRFEPWEPLRAYLEEQRATPSEGSSSLGQLRYFLSTLRGQDDIRRVGEIGFNAGLSASAILQSRPDLSLVSFDIGQHACVHESKLYLDAHYRGRHTLVLGNSRRTVREYPVDGKPFDFFLIDGGHDYETARADFENVKRLCHPQTIVVLDDLTPWNAWGIGPMRVWQEARADGEIVPLALYGAQRGAFVELDVDATTSDYHTLWGVFRYVF